MAVGGGCSVVHNHSNFNKSLDKVFEDAQVTGEIKLSGRKLKEYPKGALKHNLSDTVLADLSKNRFNELPTEVCDYPSLERLQLHHNVIKTLPDQLSALGSLSHLILSRNQLSILPSCVCQLSNLQVLDVSGNRLVSLPEELGLLTRLTELDASYNQLQLLPPSLGDLDDLRRLRLRRNLLQNIPTELCFLRLTSLDLSYNRISALPSELRFMSSLLDLLLEANPLLHPPANVCMRGRVHIFKWLDQSAAKEDKKRALSEVEFRKSRKYTRIPPTVTDLRLMNGFLDGRHKRSTVDSGYGTSENGDPRWSHGSQELCCDAVRPSDSISKDAPGKPEHPFPPTRIPHPSLGGYAPAGSGHPTMNGTESVTSSEHTLSGHSTPSTLSPGDSFNLEDEFYKAMKLRQEMSNSTSQSFDQNGEDFTIGRSGGDGAAAACTMTSYLRKKCPRSPASDAPPASRFPPPTDPTHPHNPDPGGGAMPSPVNPHPPVPTYREYLEAKRQQRAMEANNIYKRQGGDGVSPTFENPIPRNDVSVGAMAGGAAGSHPPPTNQANRPRPVGAPSPSKTLVNGLRSRSCEPGGGHQPRPTDLREDPQRELTRAHVKSIQKEAVLSYVKARVSPSKGGSAPSSPNTSFDSGDGPALSNAPFHVHSPHSPYPVSSLLASGIYAPPQSSSTPYAGTNGSGLRNGVPPPSPIKGRSLSASSSMGPVSVGVLKSRKRSGGGQPFDPDATPARLNFTYRRELEKQQHEKQLVDNLRAIIETRLKVSLPSDLSSALMDGVVLCHLVNHVRPRAVSSIHVPSPAVPKLTIAKCRLNVENFLEACRKIGVEEASLCSCDDIVTTFEPDLLYATLSSLVTLCEAPTTHPTQTPPAVDKSPPHSPSRPPEPLSENTPTTTIHTNNNNHLHQHHRSHDKDKKSEVSEVQIRKREVESAASVSPFPPEKGTLSKVVEEGCSDKRPHDGQFLSHCLLLLFVIMLVFLYVLPSPDTTT